MMQRSTTRSAGPSRDGFFGVLEPARALGVLAALALLVALTIFANAPPAAAASFGSLTQSPLTIGCVAPGGMGGECVDDSRAEDLRDIELSPDGRNLYTANGTRRQVNVYTRDAASG